MLVNALVQVITGPYHHISCDHISSPFTLISLVEHYH